MLGQKFNVGQRLADVGPTLRNQGGEIIVSNHGEFSEVGGWIRNGQQANVATGAWTANSVGYFPVTLPGEFAISLGWWFNGGTVAGTCYIGVYDLSWNLLCSANTAMSGASAIQTVSMVYTLSPGNYFLAFGSTSSTAIFTRSGGNTAITTALMWKSMSSGISGGALVSPATPTAVAANGVIMGIGGSVV